MGKSRRLGYIDIAKAIAILLLAAGHALGYSEHSKLVYKLIYCFVVPLFFMVSGYTSSRTARFCEFVKKRFRRIMVPYFIWAVLFLIPYAVFGGAVGEAVGKSTQSDYLIIARNILWGVGKDRCLQQNSTLWFLPALFVMEVTYFVIIRCFAKVNRWYGQLCVILALMAIGHCSNQYLKAVLPWGMNTMLTAGAYYYIGSFLRRYDIIARIMRSRVRLGILAGLACMGVAAGMSNSLLDFMNYRLENMWLAYVSGTALSVVILCLSYLIGRNAFLEHVGKNTMSIMLFHKLPIIVFQTKLGGLSELLVSSNVLIEVTIGIAASVLAAMCALLAAQILKEIAPYSIGENVGNEVRTR